MWNVATKFKTAVLSTVWWCYTLVVTFSGIFFLFSFSEMGARSPCEQGRCGGAWIRRYVCEVNFRVVVVVPLLLITSLWQRRDGAKLLVSGRDDSLFRGRS